VRWEPGRGQLAALKAGLFVLSIIPMIQLVWRAFAEALGANPVEAVQRSTGWWALFFLIATLAVTPLRRWTGFGWLPGWRRMLGLYAFFYAVAHFTTYAWLDVWFDPAAILDDVVKRPFIAVGFAALVIMIPLAVTSTRGMQRRLGRRWRTLHSAVYGAGILGVVHFWWLVKRDIREPLVFAALLLVLLGARLLARRAAGSGAQDAARER